MHCRVWSLLGLLGALGARRSHGSPGPRFHHTGDKNGSETASAASGPGRGHAESPSSRVQRIIDDRGSSVFHFDTHPRRPEKNFEGITGKESPWFGGFGRSGMTSTPSTAAAAVTTIGHPIRRILEYLAEQDLDEEAVISWIEDPDITANVATYQLVDNYLVRLFAGESAWRRHPGGIGNADLVAAQVALGKFEVILREECLSEDLALLDPYLDGRNSTGPMSSSWDTARSSRGYRLRPGVVGQHLVRANRWDLQLWQYANALVLSRSTTLESYLCSSTGVDAAKGLLGKGRKAVVYNSPEFHLTSASMFSCVLMSWGFEVTAVLQEPVNGFEQLLSCAARAIPLSDPAEVMLHKQTGLPGKIVLNSTAAEALGVLPGQGAPSRRSPRTATPHEHHTAAGTSAGNHRRRAEDETGTNPGERFEQRHSDSSSNRHHSGSTNAGTLRRGSGLFDVSVLCTAYRDVNVLFNPVLNGMDPRLAGALLWGSNISIWNMHGVSRAFESGAVPPAAHDFAARVPTKEGKTPPPTFLTVYGEHVQAWEQELEEAYEGWGRGNDHITARGRKESNLRGLFPSAGVVYPLLPTGNMRLSRRNSRRSFPDYDRESENDVHLPEAPRLVNFVVQGNMVSVRRDYQTLLGCLESMCNSTRAGFTLDAVGSYGNLTEALDAHPCTQARYTEGRDLEYEDFYDRISRGDFVVTASAGDDYEYNRATSSVPTALLLERPLVMASSLLERYPCLWHSRVHSMVADDDLCLNLHAAYDLPPTDYDEMELEARKCKLEMWKQTRENVAHIITTGRLIEK